MRKNIFWSMLIFQSIVFAQDYQEINVTAEKHFQTKKSNVTKTINKIKSNEQVTNVLSDIAGVQVSGDGNGQNQTLFIRGSDSAHALVIVDGVKINEVMDVNGGFNFAHLNLSNVESIEVIKGPQSVLYGANALSGVILVTTKKGQNDTVINTGFGSYGKKQIAASKTFSGHYVSGTYSEMTGQSAASEKDNLMAEKDGYKNTELLYKVNKKNWGTKLNLKKYTVDLDRQGGSGGDDPNYNMKNLSWDASGKINFEFEKIVTEFNSSFHQDKRHAMNVLDPQNNSEIDQYFLSQKVQISNLSTWHINHKNRVLGGIDYENNTGESKDYKSPSSSISKKTENKRSIYLAHFFSYEFLSQQLGVRLENEKDVAFNAGEIFAVALNHEVFFNYGNAYKYPSFYERFSSFGNENLQVNKSQNMELGWRYESNIKLEASSFFQKYSDLIEFDNQTFKYANIGESKIYGQELDLLVPFLNTESFSFNYTHLNASRTDDGTYLLKRSRHKWNAQLSTEFVLDWKFSWISQYTGKANHFGFVKNSSYLLHDFHINYQRLVWDLNFECNNILDKQYESIPGYTSPGRNFYLGMTLKI